MMQGESRGVAGAGVSYCCIGGGGHAAVVIDTARDCGLDIIGIIDSNSDGRKAFDLPVMGGDGDYAHLLAEGAVVGFVFGLGGVDASSMRRRRRIFLALAAAGGEIPALVHPQAMLSTSVEVGDGSLVNRGVAINTGAKIGRNVIVNTGAVIDHDCRIADHVHIAPSATLSGGVQVGEGALIGVGASVIQDCRIGSGAVVGAGAVVVSDVPADTLVLGVPARPVRRLVAAGVP